MPIQTPAILRNRKIVRSLSIGASAAGLAMAMGLIFAPSAPISSQAIAAALDTPATYGPAASQQAEAQLQSVYHWSGRYVEALCNASASACDRKAPANFASSTPGSSAAKPHPQSHAQSAHSRSARSASLSNLENAREELISALRSLLLIRYAPLDHAEAETITGMIHFLETHSGRLHDPADISTVLGYFTTIALSETLRDRFSSTPPVIEAAGKKPQPGHGAAKKPTLPEAQRVIAE